MSDEKLHHLVDELRKQITALPETEGSRRARLESLVGELESEIDAADEQDGILDRVRDAVTDFEAEHPSTTSVLNRIANLLSGAGL